MVASLYPRPLGVDEVLELTRHRGDRRPAHAEALRRRRRSGCASPSRSSAIPTCSSSTSRRWRWTSRRAARSGRRCASFAARGKTVLFATHYLEEADAYADRAVLMAHGRVVADGPTTEIKAMVGLRTIRATLPGVRRRRARAARRRHARRAPRRGGRAHAAPTRTRRSARCSPAIPAARDIEIARRRARGGVPRAHRRRGATREASRAYTRYELLRTFRNRRFFDLLARLPARPVLPHRRRRTARARPRRHRHLGAAVLHGRAGRVRRR